MSLADPSLIKTGLYIDGAWRDAAGGARFAVRNPATGETIAEVAKGGRADAEAAVLAAEEALPGWRALTAKARAAVLRRWHDLILEHREPLARLLTAEQGKPLAEARGEIGYGAAFFDWFAGEALRVYGDVIPTNGDDRRLIAIRQPIGVCAAITPWNFPMAMIPRKAAPALAAGCTMILKPASATPLSALALAELGERAGLPAGVFNVVPGGAAEVGNVLATHAAVRKLTFTGSTEVGRELMAKAAATIKKVSLELGGNAPVLVFDDADLDEAVSGTIATKFRNMGQTCVCANRIYVQDGIHDRFIDALTERVRALKVGDGAQEGVEQGPLIDMAAVEKVEEHIGDATAHGATVLTGGRRHALGGSFFEPTVLSGVTQAMRIAREETFGPVAPVFRFKSDAEGVAHANATEYGLAAYIFTHGLSRLFRVGEALEYGMVGVNTGIISYEGAPFGGWKESGIGREGGREGILDYLETKYLCVAGLRPL